MKITAFALMLLGIAAIANGAPPARLPMPTPTRVVLNLRYVGKAVGSIDNAPPSHPDSIQLYNDDNGFEPIPHFLGADWNGNIYLLDLLNGYTQLRCFSKTGRFVEAWRPLSYGNEGNLSGAVTKSGYIWLSGIGAGCRDLPIVIYRHGVHAPVMDFRNAMPYPMEKTINHVLAANHLPSMWQAGLSAEDRHAGILTCLSAASMQAGVNDVEVSSTFKQGVLSLRFSANGKRLLSARFIHHAASAVNDQEINFYSNPVVPYLAPDDTLWSVGSHVVTDAEAKDPHAMWTTLRVQEFGARHPALVIDRALKTPLASGRLWIKEALPPEVMLDAKHNVYVLWSHASADPTGSSVTFTADGALVSFNTNQYNEARALSVFNAHGKLIFTMPWTYTTLESGANWVQPLPDGSGFYRMMFGKTAAHIDFFRLPS